MQVSATAEAIPRSGIREIMDLAWSLGEGTIRLEAGEPSFPTPPHVVEAAARAAAEGFTRYTPNAGIPELRAALAERLRERNGLDASPDRVVISNGATQGLYAVLSALLEPGDEILLPDPAWPNFAMMAGMLHAPARRYPLVAEHEFLPHLPDLERLAGPRCRVLLLNSPSNPLGAVIGRRRLEELLAFAAARDLWVVSDECYDELVFDGEHVSPGRLDRDGRVVSVYSFSKTYAMTGWRVGYVLAPPGQGSLLAKLQEPLIACVNGIAQRAALAALTGPQEVVGEMRAAYARRRDLAVDLCAGAGLPAFRPSGAFYLWVGIAGSGRSSRDFALDLARREQVTVAPGTAFGASGEGWLRLSLATDPELLAEGVRRLGKHWEQGRAASAAG